MRSGAVPSLVVNSIFGTNAGLKDPSDAAAALALNITAEPLLVSLVHFISDRSSQFQYDHIDRI